ncbi:ligase-associated DNA damage response exonuclease [Neolewinella aurantiaca]|uniref:Ligase-associated DNA damage response exonuclease n=1 Tax=Neolewinella aurantiaca TaxID=2602767 RepID=A0A5C7G0F6_9BACT|nr:ligase-associated DNA damage response exonuclease [Neolewinella aurantiaca]TXF91155.1 ligase-associated DNA damage response exonuclease [Neolewinella aurantiaca]
MQDGFKKDDLLQFTERGIWCPPADIYIDPWRPVKRAMITHGHSDHSRYGHDSYLCTTQAAPAIKYRLGDINLQTVDFGKRTVINGVEFSFHPAGHILGSAQIRVAYKGEVWVASGDYKLENDGLAEPFESVPCHTFITESTFGLPIYDWKPQEEVFAAINDWWRANAAEGKVSLITAYSLGKAQRIIQSLDTSIGKIYTHGAVENMNEVMRAQGVPLAPTTRVTQEIAPKDYPGHLVIAPPSALNSSWIKKFKPLSRAVASGWMSLRGARRRRSVERGFVLSDHVDWKDLNAAVDATGAERVIVTHGYTNIYTKYLNEKGILAQAAQTEFSNEGDDVKEESAESGKTES